MRQRSRWNSIDGRGKAGKNDKNGTHGINCGGAKTGGFVECEGCGRYVQCECVDGVQNVSEWENAQADQDWPIAALAQG